MGNQAKEVKKKLHRKLSAVQREKFDLIHGNREQKLQDTARAKEMLQEDAQVFEQSKKLLRQQSYASRDRGEARKRRRKLKHLLTTLKKRFEGLTTEEVR